MSGSQALNLSQALAFVNQHLACWLATSENDKPHVRGMLMWFADETGFYFHTGAGKPLAEQLQKNPNVEIAFHEPGKDGSDAMMLRVSGVVERVQDEALESRLVRERAWLGDMVAAQAAKTLFVFRVVRGEIRQWTMATNLHEREVVPLTFQAVAR